jgi:hypothetical protein
MFKGGSTRISNADAGGLSTTTVIATPVLQTATNRRRGHQMMCTHKANKISQDRSTGLNERRSCGYVVVVLVYVNSPTTGLRKPPLGCWELGGFSQVGERSPSRGASSLVLGKSADIRNGCSRPRA